MNNEIKCFIEKKVFELHPTDELFDKDRLLKTKWVYQLKYNHLGEIIKYKARLVAGGYKQKYGEDYIDIFSPTLNVDCLRLLITYGLEYDYIIQSCDVATAYLNASIDQDVFTYQPEGFKVDGEYCWKLKKGLYGLKQSGLLWYKTLKNLLYKLKFKKVKIENNIFYNHDRSLIIGVYVDDLIILGKSNKLIKQFINNLEKEGDLEIKHNENIKSLLGINFNINKDYILLDQQLKIDKLCKSINITKINNQEVPILTPNNKQISNDLFSPVIKDIKQYQSLIGNLLYLARTTRPDIQFAVNQLSQFNQRPTALHLKYVKQVIQYLLNTKKLKFYFIKSNSNNNKLVAYSDADFANNTEDRKSISGVVIYYNNNLISWSAVKQKSIAQSTNESETIAANEASRNSMYLRSILNELLDTEIDIKLLTDSNGVINLAKNGIGKRSKHYETKLLYIKDLSEKRLIKLSRVDTNNNIADLNTKFLNKNRFKFLRDQLRLINIKLD